MKQVPKWASRKKLRRERSITSGPGLLETNYPKWQSASASALRAIQQLVFSDVALRDRLRTTEIERHITDEFLRVPKQLDELKIELKADAKHYVVLRPLPLTCVWRIADFCGKSAIRHTQVHIRHRSCGLSRSISE